MNNSDDKVQREESGGIPEPPIPVSAVGREQLVSIID